MKHWLHAKICAGAQYIAWMYGIIRDTIAPPVCAVCKKYIDASAVLCTSCAKSITPITTCSLMITKQYSVTVFAASRYEGVIQQLIRAKQVNKIYAARALGFLMWDYTDIQFQKFDYIVPVPLHWRRYAARGYNQAEEMSYSLSERSGKPVLDCLYRTRATAIQASLSAQERMQNVHNAFTVKNNYVGRLYGMQVLLVDDVLTTGSTLEACVRALRVERPQSITIVVGSRVV